MKVVVPAAAAAAAAADFHFDSASTTPYLSSPSSPGHFGDWTGGRYYVSAPTSPSSAAAIFRDFNAAMSGGVVASPRPSSRSSVIPFEWGDTSKPAEKTEAADDDFAFEFSGQLEMGGSSPLTADELFEKGMIRPLKQPPRLQYVPPVASAGEKSPGAPSRSPKSPKSPRSRFFRSRRFWGSQDDFDPFSRAMEETTRGRERAPQQGAAAGSGAKGRHRAARSLSPLRGVFDFGHKSAAAHGGPAAGGCNNNAAAAGALGGLAARGNKKWRLKDLLLFRSASEGRATGGGGKDPLRKYTALSPSSSAMLSRNSGAASVSSATGGAEDARNASFRSTDSGSVGGSSRGGAAAAHGRRYAAASRAAAEEMRRKTMLPYRQGLFGCLRFNPAINRLARGFSPASSSSTRTRS